MARAWDFDFSGGAWFGPAPHHPMRDCALYHPVRGFAHGKRRTGFEIGNLRFEMGLLKSLCGEGERENSEQQETLLLAGEPSLAV